MAKIKKEFKTKFTTVSNDFLFDKRMGIAERGLLITMLGMNDNWDFNVRGLAAILPNGESSIKSSLRKLEELGYLKRTPIRHKGKFIDTEYTFSDTPIFIEEGEKLRLEREIKRAEKSMESGEIQNNEPIVENPLAVDSLMEEPLVENPLTVKPTVGNQPDNIMTNQLNTNQLNINDNQSIHQSNIAPMEQMRQSNRQLKNDGRIDDVHYQNYDEQIKRNIEYDLLLERYPSNKEMINEITNLLIDTMKNHRKTMNVDGGQMKWENVCSIFMKLNFSHIQYVMESLAKNTTQIRNIKAYLLTTLYNSFFTIDNYYSAAVKHDMPWLSRG
ncbi:DUF6017 domain-containing protein [Clostridium formicaceticum]|uniref:DUF6017 domain-containing protein n=1 Tax=Clostridium formicaceticum TaxID=1497 RepID=A0AAC9RKW4_9CLOT|nr:DUF6017 domain-containing protein [Clostridium formicaceticum]AOY74749.1 hypothetical protein BJL90_01530 [Clostridium formicaceticum]ARE89136.1 hypothetical protein CLFO_35420 [Clostridium formicaceticum]